MSRTSAVETKPKPADMLNIWISNALPSGDCCIPLSRDDNVICQGNRNNLNIKKWLCKTSKTKNWNGRL